MPDEIKVDLENPEIKAAIQDAVDEAVKGLKDKNAELIKDKKELKDELGSLKSKVEGLDLDAIKVLLDKSNQDEESKLIAEGKIEEVIQKRTEKMREEHDKVLKAEKERADKAEAYAEKFKKSVVQSQIVQAAIELEALPEATPDIAFLAQTKFALDENGKAVAVDENGDVVIGKDGQTPMTPKEWVESLREQKPYYWPKPNGMGAPGSNNSKGQPDILKADGSVNMTKLAQLRNENPQLAKELAAKHGIKL
ncbi:MULTISPECIES: hypothetical protein [Acinetobacter]|jgi:hypothetical protein|uniref:Phage protein n=11 Tax=Acinetobacter calcoaceticus/baumannii complex TaxID=909768 RepID=A0AAE9SA08_ACIPI|nr:MULTISPECIES: hypothetical protein [Acinetobacter]ALJ99000.1 hypothetical protein [Acinetobacter phage Ab105-3phi]ALJ99142.1 hypothetical protein Ab1052phi_47 [Acinetobacter phage Ab105-2phi]QZI85267.1 putative peptidase [Acinetobacter phage Ab105-2phideltaCI404ad]DAG86292.1 MAG TPA: minor structural protein GP20 [Caudoviricetes sp.]HBY5501762.1 hypothetical protein [Klebsiella pneumoniae]